MCVRVIDFCIYRKHSSCVTKLSEIDIITICELLIDYIFVMFSGCVFQQTVGIQICSCIHIKQILCKGFSTEAKRS